jgi:hypothetical protein
VIVPKPVVMFQSVGEAVYGGFARIGSRPMYRRPTLAPCGQVVEQAPTTPTVFCTKGQ